MASPLSLTIATVSSNLPLLSESATGSFDAKVQNTLVLEGAGSHTVGAGTVTTAYLVMLQVVSGQVEVTIGGEAVGTYGASAVFLRWTPEGTVLGQIVLTHAADAVVNTLLLG